MWPVNGTHLNAELWKHIQIFGGSKRLSRCRGSLANEGAGVQVDAGWSVSPVSRLAFQIGCTQRPSHITNSDYVLASVSNDCTSVLSDLLMYMLNSSMLPVCKSFIARIWSPLWNRHTVCGWPVHPVTLSHTCTNSHSDLKTHSLDLLHMPLESFCTLSINATQDFLPIE